jgi:hypothetical protein
MCITSHRRCGSGSDPEPEVMDPDPAPELDLNIEKIIKLEDCGKKKINLKLSLKRYRTGIL